MIAVLAALLAQPVPAPSDAPPPVVRRERLPVTYPPAPPDAAVISNSGSTNTAGYTIVITPDGSTIVRQYDSFERKVVAAPQTRWLFQKLQQAGPLDSLATVHCMKSASFGSSTTVAWNDRSSADISCGGDPLTRELMRTIGVIVRELAIDTRPQLRRLHPL